MSQKGRIEEKYSSISGMLALNINTHTNKKDSLVKKSKSMFPNNSELIIG